MRIKTLIVGGAIVTLLFCVETTWAHLPVSVEPRDDDGLLNLDCTPIQFGIYPTRPLQAFSGSTDVYGVAAGLVSLRQRSSIVSFAPGNTLQNNYLAQAGLFSACGFNYAFEIGFINFTGRNIGVSAGLFNVESNFGYRSSDDPIPWLPGLQIGLLNAGGGIQIGLLNHNPQGFLRWFPFFNFPVGK